MSSRGLTWLILLVLGLSPLAVNAAERRVALVIGNAAYQSVGALDNPVNDARDMTAKLTALGFDVIRVENGTKPQIEHAIGQFSAKLGPDAISLFYYAGHGVQVNGHNYLVPVEARIESEPTVRLAALDLDAVLDQMTAARSRVNLVILDACRNNPFEQRFRSVSGGLASIDAPAGTLIAYATAPGKVAADGQGRNALYTSNLLRALDEPGARVEDVFKHVRVAVSDASGGAQTPWESSSLTGDFYFRPPAAPAAAATATGAPSSTERTFWESVRDSSNPADLGDYLKRYPSGAFRSLAERRIAALQPVQPQTAAPPVATRTAPAPAPKAAAPAPPPAPVAAPAPTAPPAPAPPPGPEAMAISPGAVLPGKYVARDKGACGAVVTLTINGRHVSGTVTLTPRDVAVDGDLEADNRFKFAASVADRNYPFLLRLDGKFPDLVLNGSTFCSKVPLSFTRQE